MLQLTALRNYDEYTFYHSANVAVIALALGSCVSEDHRFLSSLGAGALLHDIGKLTIDPTLLNKPGPLTPEEWAQVRQHPISGAEMIAQLPGLDKSAIVTILEHHMRWDGSGYPSRAPRRPQHLCSRIVAVADAYDAMTSRRSYSAARVEDDAMLNIAQGSGTAFDPALVRVFVGMMGLYPPRSVVRLSTGEVAIVLAADKADPARPTVRVITAPSGEFVSTRDVLLESAPDISVVACLDPQLLNIKVDDYL
jgi:HD-GYP domain-containing protein (c-di-GMP phosphodiesterase class II)